jgi:haloalkane dehalogenase
MPDTIMSVLDKIAHKLEARKQTTLVKSLPPPPPKPSPAVYAETPAPPLSKPAGEAIAATSHDVMVYGSRIHYRACGSSNADPVLFVHGNPASSYLWRNIISRVGRSALCIAPDLIGMGKSDKPAIEYRLLDHYKYFEGFIEQLGLRNLTLVVHDWGSALGFLYHARHPENVRQLAFMEALFTPYKGWDEFPRRNAPPQFAAAFRSFRGEAGKAILIDSDTNFIDLLVRPVTGIELSMDDLNEYWVPFMNREYREPVWRWPNEIPVANDPPDVALVVEEYCEALKRSAIPKLLIYHSNGVITAEQDVEWCRANLKNLDVVRLEGEVAGPIHFLQERFPREIAAELENWLRRP